MTDLAFTVRKWFASREETCLTETGLPPDGSTLFKYVVAAVIANPCAGTRGAPVDAIIAGSAALGEEFGRRIVALAAGNPIESYGKACLVGTNGEYEHGNAFITTAFAEPVRTALGGGKAWIPSTGKRSAVNGQIDVPLAHKDALYVRSHYDTCTVSIDDAPSPDEVVIIMVFASRGRLQARVGGLQAREIEGIDGLR